MTAAGVVIAVSIVMFVYALICIQIMAQLGMLVPAKSAR